MYFSQNVKKSVGKAVGVAKAVVGGYKDYAQQHREANDLANKNLKGTFGRTSRDLDMGRLAKEKQRIIDERKVSLRNSIRARLNLN